MYLLLSRSQIWQFANASLLYCKFPAALVVLEKRVAIRICVHSTGSWSLRWRSRDLAESGATAAKGSRAASLLLQPHMSADLRRPQTAHAPLSSRFVLIHWRLPVAEGAERTFSAILFSISHSCKIFNTLGEHNIEMKHATRYCNDSNTLGVN